jgi:cell division protein FtsA
VEEIFSLVQQVIRESGYEEVLSSGIVLTGGSAVMPGMIELGEDIFLKPVRRGFPIFRCAGRHGRPAPCRHGDGPAR